MLFLPELLSRQVLLSTHKHINFTGRNAGAIDARELQPRADVQLGDCLLNNSNGTPASTRAPRNMSPLMPEKQSRYAIRIEIRRNLHHR